VLSNEKSLVEKKNENHKPRESEYCPAGHRVQEVAPAAPKTSNYFQITNNLEE
jgi:hypothetical protein